MKKPLIVIFSKKIFTKKEMTSIKEDLKNSNLAKDFHFLIINSDKDDVKVFYEKDMIELDKEKLEQLLALAQ